jgi:hypothetical protein
MIWREKRTLLIILGVLLAANTMFFFTYRVQYQSRLDALDTRMDEVQRDLDAARNGRIQAERTIASYKKVEADVAEVFDEHWSTQRRRLTLMIAEVKRLAVASSLVPASYSFEKGASKAVTTGSRSKEALGASEVGVAFTVKGSYQQARRLINLLELSRQFVIIDSIGLAAGESDTLTLNLHLKTLFRDDPADAASNTL